MPLISFAVTLGISCLMSKRPTTSSSRSAVTIATRDGAACAAVISPRVEAPVRISFGRVALGAKATLPTLKTRAVAHAAEATQVET